MSNSEQFPGKNAERVLRLFARGEAFDSEGFIEFFTDTPYYQFANFAPCLDKEAIKQSVANFFSQVSALYHDIKMLKEEGNTVFVEMDVSYWRKDGSMVTLPCADIVRFEGEKISELRIFMDVNPLLDPSISVPENASVFTGSGNQRLATPDLMKQYFAEHSEGQERVLRGMAPKWSIDGPKWPIQRPASPQLQAVGAMSAHILKEEWEDVKKYLTDDIFYKVGSNEPVHGPQAVVDYLAELFKVANFHGHEDRKLWDEPPNLVGVEMDALYTRKKDNKDFRIACVDIYRMRGEQVCEWRVYPDLSILFKD